MAQQQGRGWWQWWGRLLGRLLGRLFGRPERPAQPSGLAPLSEAALLQLLQREGARARRHGQDGVLLMLELDPWVQLAQRHGQALLDPLSARLEQLWQQQLREGDWAQALARGQWAIYLPCTDALGALDAAERLRTQVAALDWRHEQQSVALSISVGVACWPHGADWREDPVSPPAHALLQHSRQALARARSAGCNCVRSDAPRSSGRYKGTRPA